VLYLIKPIERHVRRHLAEVDQRRFDRAKQFVDETVRRVGGGTAFEYVWRLSRRGRKTRWNLVDRPLGRADDAALRMRARWLEFLCGRTTVQREVWPDHVSFLRQFATDFGLPPGEVRRFIRLSLLGRLWRAWCFRDLVKGPPEVVSRLTRIEGWEHFAQCRQDGAGLILVLFHSQFSRLFNPCLRHRGYQGQELGLTNDKLEQRGFRTPAAKQFELARQMHVAKRRLAQGGLVFHLPDARENRDNARSVEFFGRRRLLATSFAELALKTGAHVVPVACRFSPRGFLVVEFGQAFHVAKATLAHEARVDSLVAQYAEFLRNEWRRYPWNIHWDHLRHFCELPVADAGAVGEQARVPGPAGFSLESSKSGSSIMVTSIEAAAGSG
jgi:lauroyl/myristoyl acyltransferase